MPTGSVPTRGRTLDHAAAVYDLIEPLLLAGKQTQYNHEIIAQLQLKNTDRVLDLGCGTGVLTRLIAEQLDGPAGGVSIGIDAAGKMIQVARKKRESATCRFETAAAEALPFADESFDAVVSSLFFHHVPLDLKAAALAEAYRVLRKGGKLVIADMHIPTTWMGALISHISRWFFLQPQIGENIRGVLPGLIVEAGFEALKEGRQFFGYVSTFVGCKPGVEMVEPHG